MKLNSLFLGSLLLLVPACGAKKSKKACHNCHCPAETTMPAKEHMNEKEIGFAEEPMIGMEESIDISEPSEAMDESMLMEESPMIQPSSNNEKETYVMGEEMEEGYPIVESANSAVSSDSMNDNPVEIAIEEPETLN
jgi:hypothetical protein